jgi:hypothetical protein
MNNTPMFVLHGTPNMYWDTLAEARPAALKLANQTGHTQFIERRDHVRRQWITTDRITIHPEEPAA